jgi:serine/threonine protein kinase
VRRLSEPRNEPAPPARPPVRAGQPATGQRPLAERAQERFAARRPAPPVVVPPAPPPGRDPRRPQPTMVAPGPPFAAAAGAPGAPRFRVIRRLGQGGFGRVWLAHDARLGHQVALKSAHAPDAETEERIQREARALAAVRHPHCVRIHDMLPASSDPGLTELDGMVLVMEFVDGPSLAELIRARGLLDDLAAARVWAGVAGALDAAHGRGVMHRDVKPGNIVIDPGGMAHLIDFGIARKTGDATLTQTGFVLGTPDFLAPEVACGERATPASDSWQLAATVSYALTGQPPRGSHPDAVSGLRAAATGARLTHLPARSAHLALLRAAMDNDPARRPPLAMVHHALEDWLHRSGARPDGPVTAARAR